MFEFAFAQALFEFAYARPQFAPLFELPPNNHSSNTVLPTIGDMGFEVQSESQRPDFVLHYCYMFSNFLSNPRLLQGAKSYEASALNCVDDTLLRLP